MIVETWVVLTLAEYQTLGRESEDAPQGFTEELYYPGRMADLSLRRIRVGPQNDDATRERMKWIREVLHE